MGALNEELSTVQVDISKRMSKRQADHRQPVYTHIPAIVNTVVAEHEGQHSTKACKASLPVTFSIGLNEEQQQIYSDIRILRLQSWTDETLDVFLV